jgi:hypothetical protein
MIDAIIIVVVGVVAVACRLQAPLMSGQFKNNAICDEHLVLLHRDQTMQILSSKKVL